MCWLICISILCILKRGVLLTWLSYSVDLSPTQVLLDTDKAFPFLKIIQISYKDSSTECLDNKIKWVKGIGQKTIQLNELYDEKICLGKKKKYMCVSGFPTYPNYIVFVFPFVRRPFVCSFVLPSRL